MFNPVYNLGPRRALYRVQCESGLGPFETMAAWADPAFRDRPPPASIVFGGVVPPPFEGVVLSGCATMEQLRRWFTREEYRALLEHGYWAALVPGCYVLAEDMDQCVAFRFERPSTGAVTVALYEERG